jgi:hypothetical protein
MGWHENSISQSNGLGLYRWLWTKGFDVQVIVYQVNGFEWQQGLSLCVSIVELYGGCSR